MSVLEFPPRDIVNPFNKVKSEEPTEPTGLFNRLAKGLGNQFEAYLNDRFRRRMTPHDLEIDSNVENAGLAIVYNAFERIVYNGYSKASPEPLTRDATHSTGSFVVDEHLFKWEIVRRERDDGHLIRQLKIDLI